MATVATDKKEGFPSLKSIDRISKIPVVETGVHYAADVYWRIKNSSALMKWSLKSVEGGVQVAIEKTFSVVPLIEMPLIIVDSIVCKSLDTVEQRVPAINYPPELLLNMTKDVVSTRIVQPAIKRVDSVKQFSVHEASKYTELAAERLDTAITAADKYVDKYLPDSMDATDSRVDNQRRDSKTMQTLEHGIRFSRKLQRRLTKRTIAEARALKKQGADSAQVLLYLLELLVKDPKQFKDKMQAIWAHLSEDEPENQIPPANVEQLITMITREVARRIVHITNSTFYLASRLPTYASQIAHISHEYLAIFFDHAIKTVNLEGVKTVAVSRIRNEIDNVNLRIKQFYDLIQMLLENLGSRAQRQTAKTEMIPLKPITMEPAGQDQPKEKKISQPVQQTATHKHQKTVKQETVKSTHQQNNIENENSNNQNSTPNPQIATNQNEDTDKTNI